MINFIFDFLVNNIFLKNWTSYFFTWNAIWGVSIFTFLCTLWYSLFWKPFELEKDFTEFGYPRSNKYSGDNDTHRRQFINTLMKQRKVGEIPPVYPNGWFVILESRELQKCSTIEINVLGLTLVGWRGETGTPYVADAYCPHLGAHLGVGGKVRNECIQCPFHGWEFEGSSDGKLVHIPYSENSPDFVKLKMWRIMETNGFIYLWYHAENEEPTWFPDPIPEVQTGEWKYRGRSVYKIACHIQEISENGADVAHLNIVHKNAMMCGGKPDESVLKWKFFKHVWSASWAANEDSKNKHRALMSVTHHMSLFDCIPFMKMEVRAHQVGPGIVYLIFDAFFGRGVLFFMVTPLGPMLQKVTHAFYSSNKFLHPFAKLLLLGEAIQLERDISIWNRKTYFNRPILTKEDSAIKSFRRWFSQFYSKNSKKLKASDFSSETVDSSLF